VTEGSIHRSACVLLKAAFCDSSKCPSEIRHWNPAATLATMVVGKDRRVSLLSSN